MRLSQFSKNINSELFKNLQNQFNSQRKSKNYGKNILENLYDTKKSINGQQNQCNLKQYTQQNLLYKPPQFFAKKQYDPEQLKKYKQSLMILSRLNQKNKNKKQKQKHLSIQLIKFFFRLLKKTNLIQKILQSYVPQQIILNEFTILAEAFRIKQVKEGQTLDINLQKDDFYLLYQGLAQKNSIKQSNRNSRRLTTIMNSQYNSSIRKKSRHRTITEKGKIKCYDKNQPLLINDQNCCICTLKILTNCQFILLDKSIWNRFLFSIQKVQDKFMIHFIGECTTINLTAYMSSIKDQQIQNSDRKRFLHDLRSMKNSQIYDRQLDSNGENNDIENLTNNNQNGALTLYELVTISRGQKRFINNRDLYIISQGDLFIQTQTYDMYISQGSIVNTSILLNLQEKNIKIIAKKTCLLVKIILNNIHFTKQEQDQLINRINEVQENRQNIYGNKKQFEVISNIQNKENFYEKDQKTKIIKRSQIERVDTEFNPDQLQLKNLFKNRHDKNNSNHQKKQRISIHQKTNITEPSTQKIYEDAQTARRKYFAKKVAIKYANNYCIFQKLIESKQKVIDVVKNNDIKKNIPIKAQIISKHDLYKSKLSSIAHQETKKQQNIKSVSFQIDNLCDLKIKELAKRNNEADQRQFKTNNQKAKIQSSAIINLEKQMRNAEKNRFEKIKRQKNKDLQNLFQVDKLDDKGILLKKKIDQMNSIKKVRSYDLKQKIQNIVERNTNIRIDQIVNQKSFVSFEGHPATVQTQRLLKKGIFKMNKYLNTLTLTQNSYPLQSFISGQNMKLDLSMTEINTKSLKSLKKYSREKFFGQKQQNKNIHTKKIMATMLTGRLRKCKNK